MKRKEARESAFLLLFEAAAKADETAEEIFAKATEVRELPVDEYVREVFFGVHEHADVIEPLIEDSLVGWKKTRVSLASLAIARLAAYEMLYRPDIPAKVSINEGIELSKQYDDEKTYMFVNGVLNAMAEKTGKKNG
ncbi:MAG: transcription antitermination factor NusB [Clostridia bacterium]|nr:transcription antitermination factor NusB [Clostridia bacterium]